jgi:VWFA-related protein
MKHRDGSRVLGGLLLALLAAGGAAQAQSAGGAAPAQGAGGAGGPAQGASAVAPAPPGGQKFSDTTQVTLVEVPVQVVRNGEPVRGLSAADFTIHEGSKQRAITGFDVVDLSAPASQALSAPIPSAAKRHFLLLFDLSNSNPKSIAKAQAAVRDSLLKNLTASDLAAVAVYSSATGLKLVLGFTSDLRQVLLAVNSLGLGQAPQRVNNDRLVLTVADLADRMVAPPPPVDPDAGQASSGRLQAALQQMHQEIQNNISTAIISAAAAAALDAQRTNLAQQKNVVAALSRAFTDLARMMEAVSGRKLVVLFSEGFDSTIIQGDEDQNNQDAMADATAHGLSMGVEDMQRFGSTRQGNQMAKMLEQFRRSGCVVESIDIGGLRGQDLEGQNPASYEASLVQIARDTGGELYRNFNDLGEAMNQLARRTAVTYVLSFQPEGLAADGSYHAIKVQLKNAPRGTEVSYRSGYFAPRPYGKRSPIEKSLAAADLLMGSDQGGSIATSVLAAPFRAAANRAYVPVVIEAEGGSLLAGAGGKTVPTEIYVYAIDANGFIQDFFDQFLQLDLDKSGPALRQGGLKFVGHLELPAGEYSLRVLLRNASTGAFGKRALPLSVPAFGPGKPVLLPPLFPEPGGRWALVRESPRGLQKDTAYPFTVGPMTYVPASRPLLRPGQDTAVALVGYNLGAEVATAGKLQSADGHDLGSLAIRLGSREPGGEDRPDVYRAAFQPPRDLAPGNYRLVVTVTGAAGAQTMTAPFTIVPAGTAAPAGPGGTAGTSGTGRSGKR